VVGPAFTDALRGPWPSTLHYGRGYDRLMLPHEDQPPAARLAVTQRIQTPNRRVRVFVSSTLQERIAR